MSQVYYDNDANIDSIKDKTIAVIGFGIQGKAQAENLKDSGLNVVVGNRSDSYAESVRASGFEPLSIDEAAAKADIIMLLIPDQAQEEVFRKNILPSFTAGKTLVIAHGYSVTYGDLSVPANTDCVLLAPRMPGFPIRNYYKDGGGVPAFFGIHQDGTGQAKERGLALAKAIGFTKAGVFEMSPKDETDIDLFMEQFLIPSIIKSMEVSFETLAESGYDPLAIVMELYASGELGEVILKASKQGLYGVFKNNASPTCQVGIQQNIEKVFNPSNRSEAKRILEDVRSGAFAKRLDNEARDDYSELNAYNEQKSTSALNRAHLELSEKIKYQP